MAEQGAQRALMVFESQGGLSVTHFAGLLRDLDRAYNAAYAFAAEPYPWQRLLGLGGWPLSGRYRYPPPRARLMLERIRLESPGLVVLSGARDAPQILLALLTYFEGRKPRPANEQPAGPEARRALENAALVGGMIRNLKDAGATQDELSLLIEPVLRSAERLSRYQDDALIRDPRLADEDRDPRS